MSEVAVTDVTVASEHASSLRLGRRLERASQALAFIVVGVPVGVLGALAFAGVILGATLSVLWLGLPLLLVATGACARLAEADRRAANRFLHTHIAALPPLARTSGGPWRRSLAMLSDRQLWRLVALQAVKPPLAVATLAAALAPILLTAWLVALGVQGIGGSGSTEYVGPLTLGPAAGALVVALSLPAGVIAIAVLDGLHSVLCTVTRALLAPRTAPGGPVREMLAESLGDETLSIAYWLPDRGAFFDEAGHQVALPDRGSGRAWTAVEHDGRRVAAIVHDAALDAGPELVQAAAAAAALAIDNERLKADLRARVEELRVSRLRIVEAGDAARRRLERDLHDGAQQQLVSLALSLRLLRNQLREQPQVLPLIDDLDAQLSAALSELRELARGIHPAMLTDQGVGPAIEALAGRAPIPVELDIAVGAERLPAPIEAAAYFVVAEALTNVAKYAEADVARVHLHRAPGELEIVVADDGAGGADADGGSGLRGLQDRVSALDGTLTIESPPGQGTRIYASIPLAPAPAPGDPEGPG
jgi:signal transduction histidine kinase